MGFDVTYTAKWTYYTVTTAKNDGAAGTVTNYSDTKITVGNAVTITAKTYLGYDWSGWYDGDTLVTKELSYSFVMPEQNLTFTAKWEMKPELAPFTFSSTTSTLIINDIKDNTVTQIVVPDYVTGISKGAFGDCTSLTSITLPFVGAQKGGTENTHFGYIFGASSSSNNDYYVPASLKEVIITGGDSIGERAFSYCTGLTSVTIPDSVTSIGYSAFSGCGSLKGVYITDIAAWCAIDFGSSSANPLYYAGNLYLNGELVTNLVIPEGVTSIGSDAFYGCSSLTSITIGDGVTSIGMGAFSGCSSLESITLPFVGAQKGGTENTHFGYIFGASSNSYNEDYVPASLKEVIITGGDGIGDYAFRDCSSLTSVTIGDGVTSIGWDAFYGCNSLEGVYITDIAAWCAIDFYDYNSNPLNYAHNLYLNGELVTELVIPEGVTSIGDYAFYGCTSLTSVTIGSGVTSIGDYAFYYCTSLTSVTIGSGVTNIDDYAFSWCSSLTSVTIGSGVTSIGSYAFSWCSSLTSVTIPDSVTSIDDWAFYECNSLKGVYITDIAAWCAIDFGSSSANPLYYAHNLYLNGELVTNLVIPEGVTSVGAYAFSDCSSLTSVTIGDGVTSIGMGAFSGCTGLESITLPFVGAQKGGTSDTHFGYIFGAWSYSYNEDYVPASLKEVIITGGESIGEFAFSDCSSLTSVTIGDGVTSIGEDAFYNCSSLTSITIGDGVTSIGDYAFYRCSSLTSITIPDGVTSIGRYAFWNCSSLTSVTIGDGVTSIGNYAFDGCSLKGVYITDIAAWCAIDFGGSSANPLYYADNLYLNGELVTNLVIPEGVTSIADYAFYNCTSLTSVTIPDSVTSIGSYAFYGCSSLTSINIPDGVTSIGSSAFSGCGSLTSIIIPDGVTNIGSSAFDGCISLTSIDIPDGVTSIGYFAFSGCSSLESVTIGNGVTSIGSSAFSDCSSLTSITIPDSVTSIGGSAFWYCSSLTSITIPDGVTSIGYDAFYDCSSLETVYYAGGKEDWQKIKIGNDNSYLTGAQIIYNYGG